MREFEGKCAVAAAGFSGQRPTLDEYFMSVAMLASIRSACPEGKRHGCAIVKNRRVVSLGYNGPAVGEECGECTVRGIDGKKDFFSCPAVHAEENAVLNAAGMGVDLSGACIYVTKRPCGKCASRLTNLGIIEVIYLPDAYSEENDVRASASFLSVASKAMSRERAGIAEYGRDSYEGLELFGEVEEELLDVMVYSYLEVLKLRKLKAKADLLRGD